MMKHMRNTVLLIAIALTWSLPASPRVACAHCQIPCGIYNDNARVVAMLEDAATIEKAVHLIIELSAKSDAQSQNQLVRWVMNKEKHAQNIVTAMTDYFLTQRVNPGQKDYTERLTKHHAVIIAAMQAKQHADIKYVDALKQSIKALVPYYPANKD